MLNYKHLASTSVDTRPGISDKISVPNNTTRLSMASSVCSSIVLLVQYYLKTRFNRLPKTH